MRAHSLSSLVFVLVAAPGCGSSGSSASGGLPDSGASSGDVAVEVATPGSNDSGASSPEASSFEASSSEAASSGFGDASVPGDAALLGDAGGAPRSFTVTNRCAQTIWAAALPATTFPGGIVEMAPGYSFKVGVDNGWSGRIWGKVSCTTTGGKLKCASDPFPSSLAELTLTKTPPTGLDFYDVSLVDGFNLPIEIVAVGHTPDPAHPYSCGDPTCTPDLNATCAPQFQDVVGGQVLACANDACKVIGNNVATSPACMYPNQYTRFFKTACPTAYSYPTDDPTSTFTCKGLNDYAVVFCP